MSRSTCFKNQQRWGPTFFDIRSRRMRGELTDAVGAPDSLPRLPYTSRSPSSAAVAMDRRPEQQFALFPHHRTRWFFPFLSSLVFSILLSASLFFFFFLFFPTSSTSDDHSRHQISSPLATERDSETPRFVEDELRTQSSRPIPSLNSIPKLAYLISGTSGDGESLKRTLRALYHPLNSYVVHLDLEASAAERMSLAAAVRDDPVYARFCNVRVVVRANLVTYRGPTMVANTLHAAAILLRAAGDWDWFVNLSASDYPLVTQDDLLYALSTYPRNLNFIEHTSDIGWKRSQRAMPIIVDPGLYSAQKSDVFWVSEKRSLPSAFKLFTGSAWMMLTREFMEYCVWGWDNLPRTALMYYANFISSPEGYFHTVICNSRQFRNTTVNHDLHFISWDNPPKQHPHFLELADFPDMLTSNAPFARKFAQDEPALDRIDAELLRRRPGGFAPGSWWSNGSANGFRLRSLPAAASALRPGGGARRVKTLVDGLLSAKGFNESHCL